MTKDYWPTNTTAAVQLLLLLLLQLLLFLLLPYILQLLQTINTKTREILTWYFTYTKDCVTCTLLIFTIFSASVTVPIVCCVCPHPSTKENTLRRVLFSLPPPPLHFSLSLSLSRGLDVQKYSCIFIYYPRKLKKIVRSFVRSLSLSLSLSTFLSA